MAILPANLARVSMNLSLSMVQQNLSRNSALTAQVQNQLSTGKRISLPSDDPAAAAVVIQLKKTLAAHTAYASNLQAAGLQLGATDTELGNLTDLLRQAQTTASANASSTVSADERAAAATVIMNIYNQALAVGNREVNGTYLFGGDRSTAAPFASESGGIRFVGSENTLSNVVDEGASITFQVNGDQVFGAGASMLPGSADLTPSLSPNTRLADLGGANGTGVQKGIIQLSDGITTKLIDLSHADTIGDVVNAINAAGVGGISATLTSTGIDVNNGGSDQISINDAGSTMAADLGILQKTALGPGVNVSGQNVNAKLSPFTNLADLRGGLGIDQTDGFVISNGSATVSIDLSSATTFQDVINQINNSGTGALAQISADGTRLDIVNTIQGTTLSIGPGAAGGTTADDLGIRTLTPATFVSQLNGGAGIGLAAGNDLQITRADGTSFQVDLDGAQTMQDVIDAINLADGGGGVAASLDGTGNRIILNDGTGASGPRVMSVNGSTAAKDLGLDIAPSNRTLTGNQIGGLAGSGLFANLAALRDGLLHNDTAAITRAATALQADLDRVIRIHGQVGASAQEVQGRQNQLDDQNVTLEGMLSQLQDTDYNEAITRFTALQTALQANLQTAGRVLGQSLLDYLQ